MNTDQVKLDAECGDPRAWRRKAPFVGLLVGAAALLLAARPTSRAVPRDERFAVDEYAGSASCVNCHRHESSEFASSAHARALFRGDSVQAETAAGRQSPEGHSTSANEHRMEYRWTGKQLEAGRLDSADRLPIDWCFGSEFGTTFVTLLEDRAGRSRLLEHHWSWFRESDVLAITPGHTIRDSADRFESFGDIYEPTTTHQCFSCHATTYRYDGGRLDSASVVEGVQCERCHGPRRRHVELMLHQREPNRKKTTHQPTARQQVYACGECHRRPDEIDDEIRPDNLPIVRFPSVGLVQSKCFLATESTGAMTCTTCHDPHAGDRPPPSYYDARCRECHDPRRDNDHVPCPVEPDALSCLGCHMPKVKLHEHLEFTDHWIRARR